MKNTEMQTIRNKITRMPYGSAFTISDFTNHNDYENIKKCLMRLEKKGLIRRVIRGIYDKPYFSNLINEYASPNINEVAKAIARNYNWKISPSGLATLNLLGLSTQVTNSYEFYSSGQYKTYNINQTEIQFKHCSTKELMNLSNKSLLVVHAIKELGHSIDDESINKIRRQLTNKEKQQILKEASGVTKWIYEVIKKICVQED